MPTGGSEIYQSNALSRLRNFDIYCIHSFFATLGSVRDDIAFPDIVNQTRSVYEDFFFRRVVNDKTKSFGIVEEFYCSCIHNKKL